VKKMTPASSNTPGISFLFIISSVRCPASQPLAAGFYQ
jgi:hypothetical protein